MSNDCWETQDDLYEALCIEFGFDFDLCANEHNYKCDHWTDDIAGFVLSPESLEFRSHWANPPFSRGNIDLCMASIMHLVTVKKKHVVTLTRFDPSAGWFKDYINNKANEVRMLDRRLKFKGAKDSYNFPCCISIYTGSFVAKTNYYSWGWM